MEMLYNIRTVCPRGASMNRFSSRSAYSLLALALLVFAAASLPAMAAEPSLVASISLSVLPDTPDGTARYDAMLRYAFTVTNTGEVVLADIELTDTFCGEVGTAASLAPGSSLEFEGWARVESGEGAATVRALTPGSLEVSATADHAIDPYISHKWPNDEAAADGPYLPFTGERAAHQLMLAAGFALLGIALRRHGRTI